MKPALEPAESLGLGLGGLSGGYSSHALLRAYGAQPGGERLFIKRHTKDGEDLLLGQRVTEQEVQVGLVLDGRS